MGRFLQYPATATMVLVLLAGAGPWIVDFPNVVGRRDLAASHSSTNSLVAELMADIKSPLSKSQAIAYAELFKQKGSVGDLCEAGHLYCDVQTYSSYYEGLLQLDEHVEDKDVRVFFRESELLVGRHVSIADPVLQAAALESNRQALLEQPKSKYTYLNVMKVPERAFLPEELAKRLPFTSSSASQVFNLDESSTLAKESSKTVQICKEGVHNDGSTELRGEAAACATSVESLQSLLRSPMLLGPQEAASVEALTTDSKQLQGGLVNGKVVGVRVKASEVSRHAVCHNLMYPSAVYFCHYLPQSRVYAVTLQLAPNDKLLEAVAMCHLDTNGWNPRHLAFQNLGTMPGQAEACHWVLQGSITFVPAAA